MENTKTETIETVVKFPTPETIQNLLKPFMGKSGVVNCVNLNRGEQNFEREFETLNIDKHLLILGGSCWNLECINRIEVRNDLVVFWDTTFDISYYTEVKFDPPFNFKTFDPNPNKVLLHTEVYELLKPFDGEMFSFTVFTPYEYGTCRKTPEALRVSSVSILAENMINIPLAEGFVYNVKRIENTLVLSQYSGTIAAKLEAVLMMTKL